MTTTAHPTASPHFERLQKVLTELLQFDQAELDFGIYRIMNAKCEEITCFLNVAAAVGGRRVERALALSGEWGEAIQAQR